MRLACIDIGTNTTRLLVAEPDGDGVREVLGERVFAGLGHAQRDGELGGETIAAVVAAVAAQVSHARNAGARSIRVVATAGVRAAADGPALLAAVRATSGVDAELLSTAEEARLAFLGATCALLPGSTSTQPVAVVDVGGGSTELAVGAVGEGVHWWVSLPLGSAVLTEQWLPSDPPAADELDRARDHVAGMLASVQVPACTTAFAAGGSATSLRLLVGPVLEADALRAALQRLCEAPCAELADGLGLDPRRARLLPAGIVILEQVGRSLGIAPRIGTGGLREGIILDQLRLAGA